MAGGAGEELAESDFPRPSNPWEPLLAALVELMGFDYGFYNSLNSNVRSPLPSLPNSPFRESEDIHIPSLPPAPPTSQLGWSTISNQLSNIGCGTGDLIPSPSCNFTEITSPRGSPPKLGLTVSVSNQAVVADLLFQIDAFIWNLTFNSPSNSPNFTYQIQSNLVSIDLTEAMLCGFQRTTNEATDKGCLSVGKYSGMLCSEENLEGSECVSDSQPVPVPVPGRGEICFSICCGKKKLAYLSARMLMKECVAQSVIVDTGYIDHPLSALIELTNQKIKSLGKRGRAESSFASEDLPTHFAAEFGGIPQGSFLHETPMQHVSEFVQEDALFSQPIPEFVQSEQLAKDTVLHVDHSTLPPMSTRQEKEASRGTEEIDNIRKCDSFEHWSAVKGKDKGIDTGGSSGVSQNVDANGVSLKNKDAKRRRVIDLDDLQLYFGNNTRIEAANKLGVSVSTVKRICRDHKISRWPHVKINKDNYSPSEVKGTEIGASVQSSLTMPFLAPLPSEPQVQEAPHRQLPTVTAAEISSPERRILNANFVTIKARYCGTDSVIKFDLPSSATMVDLEGEVAMRLNLHVGSFTIKYEDQDGDEIDVTGSHDLQYCIRTMKSMEAIWMSVRSTKRGPT